MVTRIRRGNARPALALLAMAAYLAVPGFGVGAVASAWAQTQDDLERAREHYEFAEFDQALALLNRVIARPGETPQRLRDAYVLQARCQVNLGNRNLAEDSFCEALALDRNWRPDPIFFPRTEIAVFESALAGCPAAAPAPEPVVQPAPPPKAAAAKPWYAKPVAWAGAAAAVVLAVVLLGGGDDDDETVPESLPAPPDPPVRP